MPLDFGTRLEGRDYRPRPGAYGLLERDGLIALVEVNYEKRHIYMPGGGIDAGESPEVALVREFGEETGLKVEAGELILTFTQAFVDVHGKTVENQAHIYFVKFVSEAPELFCEPDHKLVWYTPLEAMQKLTHEGFAYAVLNWLRQAS
jgi:8-oxo-dGTP diphosphatase